MNEKALLKKGFWYNSFLGECLEKKGKTRESLDVYDKVLEINGLNITALLAKGSWII